MHTDTTTPELVDLPARTVLTVDGTGAPEGPEFTRAVRALFAVRGALGDRPAGPVTETYRTDPSAVEPAELVTRVAVAISAED